MKTTPLVSFPRLALAALLGALATGCPPDESGPVGGQGGSGALGGAGGTTGGGGAGGVGGWAGVGGLGGSGAIGGSGGAGGGPVATAVELDPSFGNDGVAIFSVLDGSLTWDGASAIAVLPDDRIIVVGSVGETVFGPVYGYLAALTDRGSLDWDFGSGRAGVVLEDLDDTTRFDSVTLDGLGRIVVGGQTKGPNPFNPGELTLARYWPDGTRDETFGNDAQLAGVTRVSDPCATQAADLGLQTDGRIVVTGSSSCAQRLWAARVMPDGTPDAGFGDSGVQLMDSGYSDEVLVFDPTAGAPRIVVGGSVGEPGWAGTLDFVLAGLMEDGAYDAAFGTNGMVVSDFGDGSPGRTEGLTALASSGDGRILAGGWIQVIPNFVEPWRYAYDFLVAAYGADGALDASFGDGGAALVDLGSDSEEVVEVLLRATGDILLVGSSLPFAWEKKIAIAHLTRDGAPAFGEHQALTELEGGGLEAQGAVLDAQGRLVVVAKVTYSNGQSDVAVARYVVRTLD